MEGILVIDGQRAAMGQSQGAFTQLTVTQDMYIGGHRDFMETSKQANVSVSFEGCVQKVGLVVFFAQLGLILVKYESDFAINKKEFDFCGQDIEHASTSFGSARVTNTSKRLWFLYSSVYD